jgi:bifunctional UDP-N-acetylglucosamine pyrophosphorylase/glucosamine-1-phosphate N-acetyltransferase
VLIANGDFDPVTSEDVRTLIRIHRRTKAAATMITTEVERPGRYSRIVRDGDRLVSIVEGSDAPASMRSIREVGTNWIVFRRDDLFRALPLVGRENTQGEYYLNEVFPILIEKGERVSVVRVDTGGAMGINSRADLARTTRVLRERINARHLANGVTLEDPETTYIDVDVRIGRDTVIHPMTFLSGQTRIGTGCEIGPATRVADTSVGEGAVVEFSVVRSSRIGARAQVGPYAHVRPGTRLGPDAKVGTFVEIKASEIEEGAKVPHLSYVGDAKVGRRANVGAGTVTVNYDGYEKHRTRIGEDARVGSDTMLVAPVKLGRGAVTGAGSVITTDVPAGALAVERSEQRVVKGYRRRRDAEAETARSEGPGFGERATPKRGGRARRRTEVEIVTKKRMMLFSGTTHRALSEEIAEHLGIPIAPCVIRRFGSGEIYVRPEDSVRGADVFVIQTHADPVNESIMEQLIMIDAMKRASAKRITAVVPYYGYARQDKKVLAREPISAKLVADLLSAAGSDRVVSVDLHAGQIQGYFDFPFDT